MNEEASDTIMKSGHYLFHHCHHESLKECVSTEEIIMDSNSVASHHKLNGTDSN